ncbi:MAG: hypothetical protein JNL11_10090 [Bdellovibrionaceae bacterium]|nr:hypothetical protein [Pseudobdellovibrionaceae bacterium]
MKKYLPLVSVLLVVAYFGIHFVLKTPLGRQKVTEFIPSRKECGSFSDLGGLRYCIHSPADGKTNGDIAYALHGKDQNEMIWNFEYLYGAMVQKYWQQNAIIPPTIVTLSFGPVWVLTPKGEKQFSGLMDLVIEKIIPRIESMVGAPKHRILFGASMGGMNSLATGLTHGRLFSKIASVCPVMYKETPYSSLSELYSFMQTSGAELINILRAIVLSRNFFASEKEWDRFAPLRLIERNDVKYESQFYISGALYDEWGIYDATETFIERAKSRNLSIEWHPQFGDHCMVDIQSLAQFLVK